MYTVLCAVFVLLEGEGAFFDVTDSRHTVFTFYTEM